MKNIVFLLLVVLYAPHSLAQGIEGQYKNDAGERIVVSGNRLYYIARDKYPLQWWEKDTLAVCAVRRVGKSLLEVKSLCPVDIIPQVEYLHEERSDDSIRVHFIIPYGWDDLEISVYEDYTTPTYKNVNHNNDVMVPKCKKLLCSMRPTERIAEHERGKIYGRVGYEPFFMPDGQLELDHRSNRVDVRLPEVDSYYFSRYHVNHDYIYQKEGCLYWKGKVFKKTDESNNLVYPLPTQSGAKDVDGVFIGQDGDRIEIADGHFRLIAKERPHFTLYSNDTLAVCDARRIDNHVIEISNRQMMEDSEKAIKVLCSDADSGRFVPADSIFVHFDYPYKGMVPLEISIFTESDTIKCNRNHDACIPVTVKSFKCSVRPEWYRSFSLNNTYEGCLYYSSPVFEVRPSTRRIEVSMPALDDAFFERYYITSEYLYVKGRSIYWRGKRYKKA